MDSISENYLEKWKAMQAEYEAKAERLDAEARLKYNDAFKNFGAEVEATKDWTTASWDEFTAKINQRWQELANDAKD